MIHMKNILVLIVLIFGSTFLALGQSVSFEKAVAASITNRVALTDQNNQGLAIGSIYRVKLSVQVTNTRTGAEYLVWYSLPDTIWKIRLVSSNGVSSNHPQLEVTDNIVRVFTNHATNYAVRVFVEGFNTGNGAAIPSMLGSSYQWQRYINNLYYMDGNVGIGTDTPKEKLSVNGNIRAHQIKVETTNWPDYVFKDDYKLSSLEDTEKFIQVNGHLPQVPKAETVEKEGYSLNEMDKILLKKIEELTLHLIRLDKENKELKELILRK